MEAANDITTWEQLAFYAVAAVVIPLVGVAANRIKRQSDEAEEEVIAEAKQVEADVRERAKASEHMIAVVQQLTEQMDEMKERMTAMEQVVNIKYPLALSELKTAADRFPADIRIPQILLADIETKKED